MTNDQLIAELQKLMIQGDPNGYIVEALVRLLSLVKPDAR